MASQPSRMKVESPSQQSQPSKDTRVSAVEPLIIGFLHFCLTSIIIFFVARHTRGKVFGCLAWCPLQSPRIIGTDTLKNFLGPKTPIDKAPLFSSPTHPDFPHIFSFRFIIKKIRHHGLRFKGCSSGQAC